MSDLKKFNQVITNVQTKAYLDNVLGEKKNSFVNNLTAVVSNSKSLQSCEPTTLMFAALKATALDLPIDPNLGFAYLIPYNNRKDNVMECQFQIGYRGIVQLAIRSGQFKTINVRDVREGEIEGEDFLSGELKFKMLTENREKAKVIGYVAYFKLLNGFEKMSYWTVAELQQHGLKYSQTYSSKNEYTRNSSKWATDFDSMSKKTVLKLLLGKYAPLSVEMQQAIKFDQSVILNENGDVRYIDNEKPSASEQADAFEEAEAEVVETTTETNN